MVTTLVGFSFGGYMDTEAFRKASRLYSDTHYFNVLSCVRRWMNKRRVIHDVCSGPGDVARYLQVYSYNVRCYDSNRGFAKEAAKCAVASHVDVLLPEFTLPRNSQVLFTNASGYFQLAQLGDLLRRLHAGVLVANFIVEGDAQIPHASFKRKVGRSYVYDIGDDDPLVLQSFTSHDLSTLFASAGLQVDFQFKYADFKTERMFVLRSKRLGSHATRGSLLG